MTPATKSQGPQARGRAATRRRLVSAGARLFVRRGFHGTNSNEIARQARVATGTFYLHFEDKHALLRAIALQVHEQHQEEIRSQLEGDESLHESLELRARTLLDLAEKQGPLVRVAMGPVGQSAGVADDLIGAIVGYVRTDLSERIRRGDADPALDVDTAAECIAAMWARCAVWWAEDPKRAPRDGVVRTLVQLTRSGLTGSAEPAPQDEAPNPDKTGRRR